MRIGDIDVVPVIDGHGRISPDEGWPGTTDEDWAPHAQWLGPDGTYDMPIGCFLIRTSGRTILVDAGLGPYEMGPFSGGKLIDELVLNGVRTDDVTDVVLTHLHFDHVGWTTQQGEIVFPHATYRCHRADWGYFTADPGAVRKLGPLENRMEFWDGTTTLAPGLDTLPTPGHTPGHTALVVSSGAERLVLLGDVVHCPAEMSESEWDGLGDVDPVLGKRTREALVRQLETSGDLVGGAHLPGLAFGRVVRAEGRHLWQT